MSLTRPAKRAHPEIVDMTETDGQQRFDNTRNPYASIPTQLEAGFQRSTTFETSIEDRLQEFSIVELRELLKVLTQTYSGVRQSIEYLYDEKAQEQQIQIISFDCYSKSVWRKFNKEHSFLSGLRQYDVAFDVCY